MAGCGDHDYIGVDEEVAFRAREMHVPARGAELLKLLKLPVTAFGGREVGEFHYFRENFLKFVRMGNLSNLEATSLLQGYVEGYALTVLKRYMAEVPSAEWRVDRALNRIKDTVFPAAVTQTGIGQIYGLRQGPEEPIQGYVERLSAVANSMVGGPGGMGQVSDAVRHTLLFNTNPRYQSFLTNPAVADYTSQKLLDYAATLDKYQTPNSICSVGQVAAVRVQEKEEESAVGVMKELAAGIKKMLAEKSPKKEKP